jgi:hypothetical protein
MRRPARARDRRLIASILAIGLFQQVAVLPILHALHWANGSAVARTASSDSAAHSIAGRSDAPVRHDTSACPTCTALAQYRAGAVAPASVWHAPQELSSPIVASSVSFARSADLLVSPARAPPFLSA